MLQGYPVSAFQALGLQTYCHTCPGIYVAARDLKSGSHTCTLTVLSLSHPPVPSNLLIPDKFFFKAQRDKRKKRERDKDREGETDRERKDVFLGVFHFITLQGMGPSCL